MIDIEIPIGKRTPHYRFFEMLPGLLSYSLILLPIILSLVSPLAAAIFIIGFDIMWFLKAIGMSYRTIQGYNVLQKAQKVDWHKRLDDLDNVEKSIKQHNTRSKEWRASEHFKNLLKIAASPEKYYLPREVYNAVVVPFYNESQDILEPTIKSLLDSKYNPKNIILYIAYEERGGKEAEKLAEFLVKKYGNRFFYTAAIKHPKDMKDEVIGKGGNITYAAKYLKDFLKEHKIDPDKVIVTTLDADNRPHPSYFAYLTYEYILALNHRRCSFQPIALYINNIWDAPAPMRVLATGNSFWNIVNSVRPHMLRNFSTHSQAMSSLIDTKFWSVRTIVEDGHQYWRSFFRFDGDYDVLPIYLPIYQDAVLAESYKKTIKAQFIQLRRWAYGASDIAYVADKGFRMDSKVPFLTFITRFLRLLEGHISWAAASIIITFGAWAPLFFGAESSRSIVAHELPQIASQIMFIATGGLFLVIFLAMKMLPPRPERYKKHRTIFMVAQWAVMPIVSIGYGSASALNAQTRLLFGKYLDKFDVTVKTVKK